MLPLAEHLRFKVAACGLTCRGHNDQFTLAAPGFWAEALEKGAMGCHMSSTRMYIHSRIRPSRLLSAGPPAYPGLPANIHYHARGLFVSWAQLASGPNLLIHWIDKRFLTILTKNVVSHSSDLLDLNESPEYPHET
jgi:hypothetical protein